ncbi:MULTISPECIES: TetR/AcrR family transcriptional regulator [Streptomyces]|uniref:TetR/AcrR family transcriptional regulator n=1 Tax=Streptomyces odorifer TaxID=53450 RepID=A0A7Y6F3F2_9ACTN|nr:MULTISPECIES: TetR/AcrR family transcriptional regulator [Streptomyces]NUV36644.1 TetR/AcrR family transcriptional regulator [Streptomyces sp. KAI-27]NUV50361.1 TetR/AcrR family transcriptional regulator [Streptomyces sp. CAI-78]MCQ9707134.1 TetR/AcrR family transcriptional regulator [Streptomyces sp. BSP1]NUV30988.1 TetR/AcrR family transcriptional regulator [Streptomyces odorifer]UDF11478.1 TetR/AcrR family transcriptional regulator [Streptomyces sp. WA1-19]
MTRAEAKERNRRALLDAALEVVSRDGYRARLDEIVARAGLTTGAVYSLFGSKNGLVVALADDHLRPQYEKMGQAVPAGLGLLEAVDAFARHYRRGLEAPDARSALSLQVTLLDMALHDPELGARLAASVREQEDQLVALFAGRPHAGGTVTPHQARRLTTALRALLTGLGQGVPLGLAPDADEEFFAAAARALASGAPLEGEGP